MSSAADARRSYKREVSRARTPPKRSTRAQVAPAPALLRIWLSGARADAVFSAVETEVEREAAAAAPSSETRETQDMLGDCGAAVHGARVSGGRRREADADADMFSTFVAAAALGGPTPLRNSRELGWFEAQSPAPPSPPAPPAAPPPAAPPAVPPARGGHEMFRLSGDRAYNPQRMGLYARVPGLITGGRLTYRHTETGEYLFYLPHYKDWIVGPVYDNPAREHIFLESTGDNEAGCPDDAFGWLVRTGASGTFPFRINNNVRAITSEADVPSPPPPPPSPRVPAAESVAGAVAAAARAAGAARVAGGRPTRRRRPRRRRRRRRSPTTCARRTRAAFRRRSRSW